MKLRRWVFVVGILDILAAVALCFIARFALGLAWLGAFDLYVDLDKRGVIDHTRLVAYDPALGGVYALGHRLVDPPAAAGSYATVASAGALALSGLALCVLGVVAGRRATRQPEPQQAA